MFAVDCPSTRYEFSESDPPATEKPYAWPLLPLPGDTPPDPLLMRLLPINGSFEADGANWMTDWNERPCGTSCTTSCVIFVRVVSVVVSMSGAAPLTSTTSEVVPTSRARSRVGRWPTSMVTPSLLIVLKFLEVTVTAYVPGGRFAK